MDASPVTVAGFGVTVRPLGAPLTARFTAPVKLLRAMATFAVALPPCATLTIGVVTARAALAAVELKVAVTTVALFGIVTVHVEVVPVQPPDQPANTLPAAGAAMSVTAVPSAN